MKILFVGHADRGGVFNYVNLLSCSAHYRSVHLIDEDYRYSENLGQHNEEILYYKQRYVLGLLRGLRLKSICNKHEVTTIHAHTLRAGWLAYVACFLGFRGGYVYTGHGLRYNQKSSFIIRSIFLFLERLVVRNAKYSIMIRKSDYEKAIEHKLGSRDKIGLIHTWVKIPELTKNSLASLESCSYFVNIASVYSIKDYQFFIETAELYISRDPSMKFLWIGGGKDLSIARSIVYSKQLERNVIFCGELSRSRALYFLKGAKALLLTSKIETLPTVVIEAYALNTLVCASNYVGVEDLVIDNLCGFVYKKENKLELVDLLFKISKNQKGFEDIRTKAYEFYNLNYSSKKGFLKKYLEIYGY